MRGSGQGVTAGVGGCRRWLAGLAASALLAVGGCGYDPDPTVEIENRTDLALTVGPEDLPALNKPLRPRARGVIGLGSGCTGVDYLAVDEDGREVGRLPAGACDGDRWVIENP